VFPVRHYSQGAILEPTRALNGDLNAYRAFQRKAVQRVREMRLDCDQDALLLRVEQLGGIACHTGRERCFFRRYDNGNWVETDPVIKDPKDIYRK